MNADDLILISVDDHIAEPANMFDAHVPAAYKDQAPRVVLEEGGIEQWWYGDIRGRNLGLNAVAGKAPEMFNIDASRYDQMRPGCYDVRRARPRHERRRPAGRAQLPELDRLQRPGPEPGPRPRHQPGDDQGLQRLARRRVVRRAPRPVHPVRHPPALRRARGRQGGPPPRREGLPRGDLLREPGRAEHAVDPLRRVGPPLRRLLRHRHGDLLPPRLVVAQRADLGRRAGRRGHVAVVGRHRLHADRPRVGHVLGALPRR